MLASGSEPPSAHGGAASPASIDGEARPAGSGAWADSWSVGLIFVVTSLLAGRVFRDLFDDEVYSLDAVERARSLVDIVATFLGAADVHPVGSYAFFYLLAKCGVDDTGMRAGSLILSAGAAVLAHRILVALVGNYEARSPGDRAIAMILIASSPLLVSRGDAIRYYPLFSLCFAGAIYAHLRETKAFLASSALSGMLVSINFLGVLVYPIFVLERRLSGGKRPGRAGAELGSLVAFLLCAAPGVATLVNGFAQSGRDYPGSLLGGSPLVAAGYLGVGFFGGHSLGIVQSLALLPFAALSCWIVWRSLLHPPTRVIAANFLVPVLMLGMGFSRVPPFTYLSPMLSVLLAYWFLVANRRLLCRLLAVIGLTAPLLVVANVRWNDTPYKRNTVIPFDEIAGFVASNAGAHDVVLVTDPVLHRRLRRAGGPCVSYFLENETCDIGKAEKVLVIEGHHAEAEARVAFLAASRAALAGRTEIATSVFGVDHEARLKRLLEPTLDDYILKATIYR